MPLGLIGTDKPPGLALSSLPGIVCPAGIGNTRDQLQVLWVKAFHVIFMVTWFAGLFYLPRLFVYHAQADNDDLAGRERFKVMERKLFAISTIGMIGTLLFGMWLLLGWWWPIAGGWLHAKLALVAGLIAYHGYLGVLCRHFRAGRNRHGHVFYRWLNELPALFLVAIVILVVVKPF